MPRGLNRSGDFRNGSPVTTPIDFGTDITLPHDFGNDVTWTPDPAHFGNAVTWLPDPAHFGNRIQPPFPAPTFTSATPNHGPMTGGTPISIVGSGFSATGLEVLIGGQPCTSVVASDDNNLSCDSPAGSAGLTDIEIITDGGSVDAPNAWTYDVPAVTLLNHTIVSAVSFNIPVTTPAINSTGASLLFVVVNSFTSTSSQTNGNLTLTDSKGNTWRPVPNGNTQPSPGVALFYVANPITGSGHTVSASMSDTGAGGYLAFSAWSNTHSLIPQAQVSNSGTTNHAAPFQGGSIYGATGDLILSIIGGYNAFSTSTGLPASVDTGFTIIDSAFDSTSGAGGGVGGLAYGYLLAPNSTPVNPTWTMQAAVTGAMVVNVVFAKASTATVQLVAQAKATSAGATATTPAIDTTGANFLIASVNMFSGSGGPPTVTDSFGNTWVNIPWVNSQQNGKPAFYYAFNATVGAGHTFTVTGADGAICVMAFSGVQSSSDPLESANDTAAISGQATYQATAAITPASAGDLVVTAIGNIFATNPLTIFLSVDQNNLTGGWTPTNSNDSAGAIAFSIAADNTTPLQPTWTGLVSNSDFNRGYNNFAVFKHA